MRTSKPLETIASPPALPVWVVVADGGRARVFQAQRTNGHLTEIDDLINGEARQHHLEIVSDRPGHIDRGSNGIGHSFEPRQWPAEHLQEAFAKSVCKRLGDGRRRGAVGRIYLLADPGFLGLLRKNLDRVTRRIVADEKAIDLTRRSPAVIRKALPKHL